MGLLLVALAGCGRPAAAPLAQVKGRVFYRGRPLPGGTIVFTPDPERGGHGPQACAEIGPDGRYQLRTGPEPGAVPGWHRVTVAPASPAPGGDAPPTRNLSPALPARYSDPEQSGECREVKLGQLNTLDLHLQ